MGVVLKNYRADIDGLRAIAVLAIILYHFQFPYIKGGFIGVDIFFVVSGYLISSIIINGLEEDNFSFKIFYKRRILRLFPALFFMLSVTTLMAFLFCDYEALKNYGISLMTTMGYVSNFYFRSFVGYFSPAPQQMILLHTWSLSVEEQFYLFFPLFIWIIHKYFPSKLSVMILTMCALSVCLSILVSEIHPQSAFYLLPTRAWEFGMGMIIVLVARNFNYKLKSKYYEIISMFGLILLLIPNFTYSHSLPYPSYYAVIPVLGTAIIIFCGQLHENYVSKLLSSPALVFIGKISYSLYLWHWVLFYFYSYFLGYTFGYVSTTILLIATFGISIFSWFFIEQKFRYIEISFKKTFLTFISFGALFIFIGYRLYKEDGFPNRFFENRLLSESKKLNNIRFFKELKDRVEANPNKGKIVFKRGDTTKVAHTLFWGDSHLFTLKIVLDTVAEGLQKSYYIATYPGNIPLQGIVFDNYFHTRSEHMNIINDRILKFILNTKGVEKVVLIGRWNLYLGIGKIYDNFGLKLIDVHNRWKTNEQSILFEKGLRATLEELRRANKEIIMVTQVPTLDNEPSFYVMQKKYLNKEINNNTPNITQYEKDCKFINTLFNHLKREGLVSEIIPLHESFFEESNHVILIENNKILFSDYNHLSDWGALKVKNVFEQYFRKE